MTKGKVRKTTAKFSYSIYSNVSAQDPSICGIYVSLYEVNDGNEHSYTIELLIPYIDLLKYQAFEHYDNSIVGELLD